MSKRGLMMKSLVPLIIAIIVLAFVLYSVIFHGGEIAKKFGWLIPDSWIDDGTTSGVNVVRYDISKKNVSYFTEDGWEEFKDSVQNDKGYLFRSDVIQNAEDYYYGFIRTPGYVMQDERVYDGWPYIIGFEDRSWNYGGEYGYIIFKKYYTQSQYDESSAKRYSFSYFLLTPSGKLFRKESFDCCDNEHFNINIAELGGGNIHKDGEIVPFVVKNQEILNGNLKIGDNSYVSKDTVDLLKLLNGVGFLEYSQALMRFTFMVEELKKRTIELKSYSSEPSVKLSDTRTQTSSVYQIYHSGNPTEIFIKKTTERTDYSGDAEGPRGYTYDESYWVNIKSGKIDSYKEVKLNENIDGYVFDEITKWKNAVFVKPIAIEIRKSKDGSEKEIYYYCSKIYDNRYIVIDLDKIVNKDSICSDWKGN